jgi:hypothetical protein
MTQSYSPKMPLQANEQLIQMMSTEQILISDKLMKLEVENKEMFSRYHKLRRAFNELLDIHDDLRQRAGLDYSDKYDWCDKAGLLDDIE